MWLNPKVRKTDTYKGTQEVINDVQGIIQAMQKLIKKIWHETNYHIEYVEQQRSQIILVYNVEYCQFLLTLIFGINVFFPMEQLI